MFDWIGLPPEMFFWMAIASGCMFLLGVMAVPWLLTRIPPDYFSGSERPTLKLMKRHRWLEWIWHGLKNLVGIGFVFFGVLMLVLPGQGLLTILLGISLADFPGKYRLQRWVTSRRGVLESINWIRSKRGKGPLVMGDRK